MSNVNQLGKYQPYPDYKDSGVEWLGDIPEHWVVNRIKNITDINPPKSEVRSLPSGMYVTFLPMEAIGEKGELDISRSKQLGEVLTGYTYVTEGDVMLAKITPCFENGKAAIAKGLLNGVAFATTEVIPLRCLDNADAKFLYYLVTSDPFKSIAEGSMYGAGGQKRVADSFVAEYHFCQPSNSERIKIAAFLDYETARIDQLIAKQQQLIELLKEKRQAVISHAVTKGLNPNASMKDSGVEWLGQVPEHWVIKKISWDFSAQKGRNGQILTKEYCGQNQGSYPVYSGQTENDGVMGYISTHEFDFGSEGCLFSTTVGAKAMTLSLLKGKFSLSQNCMIITKKPQSHFNIEFSFFHFQPLFRYERGLIPEHMQASFRMEDLYQYSVAAPSIEEQICIVSHIKNETLRIDKLIQLSTESILYAQERRTALISAAVTGKIDLRGWQPPKCEVAA